MWFWIRVAFLLITTLVHSSVSFLGLNFLPRRTYAPSHHRYYERGWLQSSKSSDSDSKAPPPEEEAADILKREALGLLDVLTSPRDEDDPEYGIRHRKINIAKKF